MRSKEVYSQTSDHSDNTMSSPPPISATLLMLTCGVQLGEPLKRLILDERLPSYKCIVQSHNSKVNKYRAGLPHLVHGSSATLVTSTQRSKRSSMFGRPEDTENIVVSFELLHSLSSSFMLTKRRFAFCLKDRSKWPFDHTERVAQQPRELLLCPDCRSRKSSF